MFANLLNTFNTFYHAKHINLSNYRMWHFNLGIDSVTAQCSNINWCRITFSKKVNHRMERNHDKCWSANVLRHFSVRREETWLFEHIASVTNASIQMHSYQIYSVKKWGYNFISKESLVFNYVHIECSCVYIRRQKK